MAPLLGIVTGIIPGLVTCLYVAKRLVVLLPLLGLTTFFIFAHAPNPFDPDVCTSRGYGVPFASHVSWCGCHGGKEENRRGPQIGYLAFALIAVLAVQRQRSR